MQLQGQCACVRYVHVCVCVAAADIKRGLQGYGTAAEGAGERERER